MVADDDVLFRALVTCLLSTARYRVDEASDGVEAIARARKEQIDLLITDLVMPNSEGIETIQDIRRSHPDVKVIAMSGSGAHKLYLDTATKFGAHATLNKPFRPDDLREIVGRVLGR